MENNLSEKEKELAMMLKSLVEWWETWVNSPNPTDLADPPIEEAKAILQKSGINVQSEFL
jgi:hypothetical protein